MKAAAVALALLTACTANGYTPPHAVALQPSCLAFCYMRVQASDDTYVKRPSDAGSGQGSTPP